MNTLTTDACPALAPSRIYVLHNESTAPEVTRAWLLVVAADMQLAYDRDFAPAWGKLPVSVVVCESRDEIPAGARVTRIVDSTPEAPGAIAYHSRDAQGRAILVVSVAAARSEGGSVQDAISKAASHELFEAAVNPSVNRWIDIPGQTKKMAFECCDPVQGDWYRVNTTAISSFVFEAYFDPDDDEGPWDFKSSLLAPMTIAPGGYLSYDDGSNVFGSRVSDAKRAEVAASGRVAMARAA